MPKDNKIYVVIPFVFFIFLIIVLFSHWYGISVGYDKTITKNNQLIELQKDLTKSLKNQLDYIDSVNHALNSAHEKVIELEKEREKKK